MIDCIYQKKPCLLFSHGLFSNLVPFEGQGVGRCKTTLSMTVEMSSETLRFQFQQYGLLGPHSNYEKRSNFYFLFWHYVLLGMNCLFFIFTFFGKLKEKRQVPRGYSTVYLVIFLYMSCTIALVNNDLLPQFKWIHNFMIFFLVFYPYDSSSFAINFVTSFICLVSTKEAKPFWQMNLLIRCVSSWGIFKVLMC